MSAELDFISTDYFGLRFPYSAARVAGVRRLADRRWNKNERRWEIHVAHLGEITKLFALDRDHIDRRITRAFQIHQIRNCRLRIRRDTVYAQLVGTGAPLAKLDNSCSYYVPSHQYMPRFIQGKWDGKRHLFDKRRLIFPTGLLPRVRAILEEEKVQYQVVVESVQAEKIRRAGRQFTSGRGMDPHDRHDAHPNLYVKAPVRASRLSA